MLLQDRPGRHLRGPPAVSALLLRGLLDVLVLALFLGTDPAEMMSSSRHDRSTTIPSGVDFRHPDLAGTVGATEHAAGVVLDAVADDPTPAVIAGGRQQVDGALEAIEGMTAPPGVDR
jgi:hypothetical protein